MRRNRVIVSINGPDGLHCVDLFERADGTFGYALCRRDPEDGSGWRFLGHYEQEVFRSETAARAAMREQIAWAL
ncbi:MAG: hypothetical protein AAFV87_05875 [Pseudomonadota bacterium]